MASIPAPIRATLGLLATALDTVQELVEHAPELPMEAVGNSMQLSLRLQQHYVALLTRGDEFLANLRGAPDDAPAWATFDETPVTDPPAAADTWPSGDAVPSDDAVPSGNADVADLPPAHRERRPRGGGQGDPLLDAVVTATAPAKKAARKVAKVAPVTVSAPRKPTAKKAAKASAAPAKKAAKQVAKQVAKKAAPAKKAATKAPAHEAPVKRAPGRARKVSAPKPADEPAELSAVAAAPPVLDAELDNGAASARPQSAFDLAIDAPEPATEPAPEPASGTADDPSFDPS